MAALTRLELAKEAMKFSAGHFTIFDATHRERLHGHNFTVSAAITSGIDANGLAVDYGIYKQFLLRLCQEHNEYFLLPGHSPHLRLGYLDTQVHAHFNGEVIPFLASDIRVLPVRNITLEEMAPYLLAQLLAFREASGHHQVVAAELKVSSGPGQSANACWQKD